jgi:Reverse transcriptase (RNA-dependent DNA polymerase)
MACHIVLLPKKPEPKTPRDYRSLGICNFTYRLLAKIITNRLQPYIKRVIFPHQSAFVEGRCIADNTVLMREVVHSFNAPGYQACSFALKADRGGPM